MARLDKTETDNIGTYQTHYLDGHLLLAMPNIGDPRFERAAIYVCAHDARGAMGIIVNNLLEDLEFGSLLRDLEIQSDITLPDSIHHMPVLYGGPVEVARGFLVHSSDFKQKDTIEVQNDIHVTGTIDALEALGADKTPQNLIFALGYAGWEAGQLEQEVRENAWIAMPATQDLIFNSDKTVIWDLALKKIGITPYKLSHLSGSA